MYQRAHLDEMSTLDTYTKVGEAQGLEFVEYVDFDQDLITHYDLVRINLRPGVSLGGKIWICPARKLLLLWCGSHAVYDV